MAPLKLNGGDPTKNLLGMLLGGKNGTKEVPGVEFSSPAVAIEIKVRWQHPINQKGLLLLSWSSLQ